jgi:hypothetical protein
MLKFGPANRALLDEFDNEEELSNTQNRSLLLQMIKVYDSFNMYSIVSAKVLCNRWMMMLSEGNSYPTHSNDFVFIEDDDVGSEREYMNTRNVHVQMLEEFNDVHKQLNQMDSTLRSLLNRHTS